jgi:Flp pilus assembly protein TadD
MTDTDFERHLMAADTAVQAADWPTAVRELKAAGEFDPESTMVLTALGTCLIQSGDPDSAVACFEKVAALEPDSLDAYNNLGLADLLAGMPYQAEQAFKRAIELDAENQAIWKNLAQACLMQEGRLGDGVQILASIIQAHPDDVGALVMLAALYEEGGELESAEILFSKAAGLQPDYRLAVDGMARVSAARETAEREKGGRIARPEHAAKLAALKSLKSLKKSDS